MARPEKFEIRDTSVGADQRLAVEGELDLSTVPALARSVEDRQRESRKNLTLDLSAVTFMDSSGLRLLIELGERARRERWELTLVASRHEAANAVLRMTGADSALPFEQPDES
jgi:anti-sigma B factor antagonist